MRPITEMVPLYSQITIQQLSDTIFHKYKHLSGNQELFMNQFREDYLDLSGNRQFPGDQFYNALLKMAYELEEALNVHGLSIYALPLYKRYLQCLYAMANFRSHENADLGKIALGAFKKLLQSVPLLQNDLIQLYQQNSFTEPLGDDVLKRFPDYIEEWLRSPPLERVRLEFVYFDNEHFHSKYRATRVQNQDLLLTEQMLELYCACELSTLSTAPYCEFMREFFRFSVLETFGREKPAQLQLHNTNLASVERGIFFLQRQNFKEKIASQAMLGFVLRKIGRSDLSDYLCYGLYMQWQEKKENNFQIIKFLIFMALQQGRCAQENNLVRQFLDIYNGDEIIPGYGYEQVRELVSMYEVNKLILNEQLVQFVGEHLYFTEAVFDVHLQNQQLFEQLHQLQQGILQKIYSTINQYNQKINLQYDDAKLQEQLMQFEQCGRHIVGVSLDVFLSLNYGYKKQFILVRDQQSFLLSDIFEQNVSEMLENAGFSLQNQNMHTYEQLEAQLLGVQMCENRTRTISSENVTVSELHLQHYLNSILEQNKQENNQQVENQDQLSLLEDVFAEVETDKHLQPQGSRLSFQVASKQLNLLDYPATTPAILTNFLDECAKKITHTDPNNRNEWGCIEKDKGDDSLLYRTIYNILTFFD